MPRESGYLTAFVGRECPHCRRMEPVIAAVERRTGEPLERLEVWHDPENAARMRAVEDPLRQACGGLLGVPAFYNERTGEALCGEVDLETLHAWAAKRAEGSHERR